MGQYATVRRILAVVLLSSALALITGCGKAPEAPATQPGPAKVRPTVASVVPAATDIIRGMHAEDHLVGVSNYEPKSQELAGYDRVGDYNVTDWEKLTQIRPDVLVIQRPQREMTQVFLNRAQSLKMTLVDIHMDRLDEIFSMITRLGDAIKEQARAKALLDRIHQQLDEVSRQASARPAVPTLLVLNEDATFIAGSRNYLDDMLSIAGGINVAGSMSKDYPNIDREQLMKLDPEAIIQFLPESPPQVVKAAREFWSTLPQLRAVKNGRVYIHSEWFLELPAARVGDVAQIMVNDLHPPLPLTTTAPATTTEAK